MSGNDKHGDAGRGGNTGNKNNGRKGSGGGRAGGAGNGGRSGYHHHRGRTYRRRGAHRSFPESLVDNRDYYHNNDRNFDRTNDYDRNRNFPKFKDNLPNRPLMPPNADGYYENPMNFDYENKFQMPETMQNNTARFATDLPEASSTSRQVENETLKKQDASTNKTPSHLNTNSNNKNIEVTEKPVKTTTAKKQISKSSSSSSSSDSDDSSIKKKQEPIKNIKTEKNVSKNLLPIPKIKKEPGLKEKKKLPSTNSSSDSSSDDSSSTDDSSPKKGNTKVKNLKKKSEEEVVCLGKLEKFENLVDDDDSNTAPDNNENETCLLCDKKGHNSFHCQMICKNCGAQYHNLKICPKPANLSMMLQNFLEFCLNQCTMYNPDQRFSFRNGNVQTELLPAFGVSSNRGGSGTSELFGLSANENLFPTAAKSRKRKHLKSQSNNNSDFLNSSKTSFKSKNNSDSEHDSGGGNSSESSSSEATTSTKRKTKRQKVQQNQSNSSAAFPGHMGFATPFAFNSPTTGINPMMAAAFSQMMGFNPSAIMNFSTKASKEKMK